MNHTIHHPFLNVPGLIGRFQLLEDGRQAYVSWARSQPDQGYYAGEICRKNGDVAVFLGTEDDNDYFMHILGGEVPDEATAVDFEQQEFVSSTDFNESDDTWDSEEQDQGHREKTQSISPFDRCALSV